MERIPIEMEAMGTEQESYSSALPCVSDRDYRTEGVEIHAYHGEGDLLPNVRCEAGTVGWRGLDRWVRCGHGMGAGRLADRRMVGTATGAA